MRDKTKFLVSAALVTILAMQSDKVIGVLRNICSIIRTSSHARLVEWPDLTLTLPGRAWPRETNARRGAARNQ